MQPYMVCFSCIYASSIAGEVIEHIFPLVKLLTKMHVKHTIKTAYTDVLLMMST